MPSLVVVVKQKWEIQVIGLDPKAMNRSSIELANDNGVCQVKLFH